MLLIDVSMSHDYCSSIGKSITLQPLNIDADGIAFFSVSRTPHDYDYDSSKYSHT
jgi:hypothetical protein